MSCRLFSVRVVVVVLLGACTESTGGERFDFAAAAGGASESALPFTNQRGWSIDLSRAELSVGPVYLNAAAPLRGQAVSWWSQWVPMAHAAGEDHLAGGRVLGEVLGRVTFDALSPVLVPFSTPGTATSEQVRTADVWLYPPPGVSAEATKNIPASLSVAGVASRGQDSIPFRGELKIDENWLPEALPGSRASRTVMSLRQIRGLSFSFLPKPGGRLEMRVDVRELFRGADFGSLEIAQRAKDGSYVLSQAAGATDQVMTNLYQGLRATRGVYAFTWQGSD